MRKSTARDESARANEICRRIDQLVVEFAQERAATQEVTAFLDSFTEPLAEAPRSTPNPLATYGRA